jgi:hypothetical protein
MAACVHEPFTGVDLCEIKIRNGLTLAGFERFANDLAFRVHDSGEATTGNWPDGATGVLHDLVAKPPGN